MPAPMWPAIVSASPGLRKRLRARPRLAWLVALCAVGRCAVGRCAVALLRCCAVAAGGGRNRKPTIHPSTRAINHQP
ncbi:uncharacterized protein UV8b_01306 [Ustilaginoidea virens]|uniref:Uncharacterized protein n=1 Tax=Ustilaginoidea virens TaxID=1159556 RepID=A0A8E5HKC9_USTVR|nr:uncharacterized protein UV8b_01306 [Ustilaginoidea virens]QUC17065.1 hypothetical protein UV8b_01306 [Ustilaginoidea virens]